MHQKYCRSFTDLVLGIIISVMTQVSVYAQSENGNGKQALQQLHNRAVNCFKAGDVSTGKLLFQELIEKSARHGNEEIQGDLWQELARAIPSRDTAGITRLYCYEKMVNLYKIAGKKQKEIEALKSIADLNMVQGRLDLAEKQLLNVLSRYKAIGYGKLYYVYDLLAVTNRYQGDFSRGIFYSLKAVQTMEAAHDFSPATTFYSRLANMYRELGQTEKSVEWYWKVFTDRSYTETVNLYMFRDAGFLARALIRLKKQEQALAFIQDVKAKNIPNGMYAKASLLSSLAECYRALGQNELADKYYLKLIKLAGQLKKDNEVTTDVYYQIGQYYLGKHQYEKAKTALLEASNSSSGINSVSDIKDIYKMLYKADSASGDYRSAAQYLMKHMILTDSIFSEVKSRQIEELQVRYETAKKKKDIEMLNSQNQQANKIKNIALTAAALFLIIIALLLNRYLIKQRNSRRLEAHQFELDKKNSFLQELNLQQEKLLKEKGWLINEVHHRVKNNLQLVASLLNTQSAYLKDDAAVAAVNDSLRRIQTMSLVHQRLYEDQNTNTIVMDEFIGELINYLSESYDTGSQIVFQPQIQSIYLDVSLAVPLGLIINESVGNAIRYAFSGGQQGTVRIALYRDGPEHLLLKISDNGVGLSEGVDLTQRSSLGLDLMRGLTKQLKGDFTMESSQGVHITVRFMDFNK